MPTPSSSQPDPQEQPLLPDMLPGMASAPQQQPKKIRAKPTPAAEEATLVSSSPPRCFVRVQLEGSAAIELDYSVPADFHGEVSVGSRVQVPLQKQRVPAVVMAILDSSPHAARLRPIHSLIGARPMFTPALVKLAHWISEYYATPVQGVLRTMLPQQVRDKPGTFIMDSQFQVVRKPDLETLEKLRKRAPMQARLLEKLISIGGNGTLSDLRRDFPRAAQLVSPLIEAGWLTRAAVRVERDPFENEQFLPTQALTLTEEQTNCMAVLNAALDAPDAAKPILLHGVTGSGKTEVYLQSIARVLEAQKTALVLVPEISLTPQTIERFKARFSERKERIAVLHSHLSDGERHDEWFKIHEGRADIVIGARSAIFAPLENIGIIIVDEEHEPSYKQEETPRYHARDLAVVRGKLETCVVVLGSATPSLESFENTQTGKYTLTTMRSRTDGKSLPLIRVVDLRLERRKGTGVAAKDSGILSVRLRTAITSRLEKREQTILFLNRRGFNTSLTCTACGEAVVCHECSVPMTLHKKDNRLVCHICGAQRVPPKKCPACGDPSIKFAGFGTERAEALVREVFPHARIARVDTDTMQRKNQLRDTLRDFRAQKLDILIGTQMIAKGLDFPNVTLVGVLNADLALNLPDFRAAERTFQLLVQVAGRSGRGEIKGEVFIQTFTPHSPAIQFARQNDYDGYAAQEIEHRQAFQYPPFTHVVLITCRGAHQSRTEFALQTLARRLKTDLPPGTVMGEPMPSPLEKAHGQYRFQLLLRAAKIRPLSRHILKIARQTEMPQGVTLVWDVDPMHLG